MNSYIQNLRQAFLLQANPEIAMQQKAYMRNKFDYFGLKSPEQTAIRRDFIKQNGLPDISNLDALIHDLWLQPEREFQYFAMMLTEKFIKKTDENFIAVLGFMITTKSWWDTVDYIAATLVGKHFKRFPEQIPAYTEKWMASGDFWLQRAALLFQLKYKKDTDLDLMFNLIERLADKNEFFIRKAIGWVLREYSKTDPEKVIKFVENHELKPLSRKEALKVIERER
ncbi:MAG: DNA alkylation repair protein [Bacteroidales bacterium]|nr:DNA alkylation repair protein [Bacteroidales bacterium]